MPRHSRKLANKERSFLKKERGKEALEEFYNANAVSTIMAIMQKSDALLRNLQTHRSLETFSQEVRRAIPLYGSYGGQLVEQPAEQPADYG